MIFNSNKMRAGK